MNFREKNKPLIDMVSIIFLATLALIFSFKTLPIAVFLFPIPFVVLGILHGRTYGISGLVASSLALAIAYDISIGLSVLAIFLPVTISLILLIEKSKKPMEVLAYSSLVFFTSILVMVFIGSYQTDFKFVDHLSKLLDKNLTMQLDIFKNNGYSNIEIEKIEGVLRKLYDNILVTIPSIFAILSFLVAYIDYSLSVKALRREGREALEKPVFSDFKLPKNIFGGVLIMLLITYVLDKFTGFKGQGVLRNLVVLVTFFFFLQGLAVLDYNMKRRGVKTFGRVVSFIIVFILPLRGILSFIGVLDSVMDFRKMMNKGK